MNKETEERIKADAEEYATGIGDVYRKYAAQYGYIAGATAEHDFATPLYDALLELFALKELKDKHGKTPEYLKRQPIAWQKAKEALSKWKGKEVPITEEQAKKLLNLPEDNEPKGMGLPVEDPFKIKNGSNEQLSGADRNVPGKPN